MSGSFSLPILTEWLLQTQTALRSARAEIDALNVFPVPDGDTGTNLYLTWEAACAGFRHTDERSFESTAHQVGRDAILGARGNSGVIMSALLRDMCANIAKEPQHIAQALRAGAVGAYSAVASPVEGTILTVARACADRAEEISLRGGELSEIVVGAADAAYQALLETPDLLVQLRNAGVVDAGGRGLVVVLDSLVTTLTGVIPRREFRHHSAGLEPGFLANGQRANYDPQVANVPQNFEVMYHLTSDSVDTLHNALAVIGQSITIAGIDGLWNVHVHVSPLGIADAINAGLRVGVVSAVSVTALSPVTDANLQLAHQSDCGSDGQPDPKPSRISSNEVGINSWATNRGKRAIVAVTHGVGVESLLMSQGIMCVPVLARQQPSAAELISAGKRTECGQVILLPSDKDAHAVAEIAAAELRGLGVRSSVIPTKSITQTLSAAAVHDSEQDFEHDVVNMTRAASSTHYGAVTQATRNVLTMAGECQAGDILGVIDGEIAVIGKEFTAVSRIVLDRMLAPGADLVTIVRGQDSEDSDLLDIKQWLQKNNSLVDVDVIQGEQPLWPFIFGVE